MIYGKYTFSSSSHILGSRRELSGSQGPRPARNHKKDIEQDHAIVAFLVHTQSSVFADDLDCSALES